MTYATLYKIGYEVCNKSGESRGIYILEKPNKSLAKENIVCVKANEYTGYVIKGYEDRVG